MMTNRPLHSDFEFYLNLKNESLVALFLDLRAYLFEIYPDSNELLYNSHALTSVFSISEKLTDAFCHIPIYQDHLNLGFNKGTMIDSENMLEGSGKLIRHLSITTSSDYRNAKIKGLIDKAIDHSLDEMSNTTKSVGQTLSKIRK